MVSAINAFEAKNRLGRLLDRVQAGEEITITRRGTPVAMLVPIPPAEGGNADHVVELFKRVRHSLAKQGAKISRRDVRNWASEGRR